MGRVQNLKRVNGSYLKQKKRYIGRHFLKILKASQHKTQLPSFGTQEGIKQIESYGYGHVSLVSLINGVDQSPVISQSLVSEHPVDYWTRKLFLING